ncbi:MAG: DUF167 family protein [Candidatus Methanomethylophilaceae archaeon]
MEIADIVRTVRDGCEIDLMVSPRSNRCGPEGVDEWRKALIFRVKAPPLEGRANKEVQSLMTEITGFRCEVIRGMTSRQKTVLIHGDRETAVSRLEGR